MHKGGFMRAHICLCINSLVNPCGLMHRAPPFHQSKYLVSPPFKKENKSNMVLLGCVKPPGETRHLDLGGDVQ